MRRIMTCGLLMAAVASPPAHADGMPKAAQHYRGWTPVIDEARPILVAHELVIYGVAARQLDDAPAMQEVWSTGAPAMHSTVGVGEPILFEQEEQTPAPPEGVEGGAAVAVHELPEESEEDRKQVSPAAASSGSSTKVSPTRMAVFSVDTEGTWRWKEQEGS